jgi:PKD repeat protein
MKKSLTLLLFCAVGVLTFAQPSAPYVNGISMGTPDWGSVNKSVGDSCGAYFNNYIGLEKTNNLLIEYMRTGDLVDNGYYNGRAQRFTVSQPVEVSGVEFYAYHESMTQDSIMVITALHNYSAGNDSVGSEIIRDTVYVTHTAFTAILPNISVKSYFDVPVVMTTDYVITMHSTENEELIIVTNDWGANEGNGENLAWALYQNPFYPTDDGWYSNLNYNLADYDFLMSPLVKYDLHNSFTILNDTICPDVISAGCVSYVQVGNFTNHMYNYNSATPSQHLVWLWGDGFQNTDILTACHTYNNPGTFNIVLKDTLFRHDFVSPYCVVNITQPIVALDVPDPSFTFLQDGLSADFTNTSTNFDSVWWDFGDATAGTDLDNPSHTYTTIGPFDVWLHAYNMCYEDSVMMTVVTDDVGIDANEAELLIYPNPANTTVHISGLKGEAKIEILNMLGECIYLSSTSSTTESLPVNQISTGTYFVRISDANGIVTKKIAVKH